MMKELDKEESPDAVLLVMVGGEVGAKGMLWCRRGTDLSKIAPLVDEVIRVYVGEKAAESGATIH